MTKRNSGFILPVGLVLCVALLALGWALSGGSRYQMLLARSTVRGEQAQAAADGGLVVGILGITASASYAGSNGAVTLGRGPETYTVTVQSAGTSIPSGSVPTGCVYVTSVGRAGSAVRTSAALVKLGTTSSGFKGTYGILGSQVYLSNGASTNSYNSLTGATRLSGGSVATNSKAIGSVRLLGGSQIYGPVALGPESSVEPKPLPYNVGLPYTLWHDWGTTYGTTTVMTKPIETPPVSMPAAGSTSLSLNSQSKGLSPGAYDDVTISNGAKLELAPGTYVFNTLTLSGGAKIDVSGSGPVKIFVHEKFDLSNGVKVDPDRPQYLQLFLGPKSKYTQSGGTTLTAVVYGPGVDIDMNNSATINGCVVGANIQLSGSANVNYDETLSEFTLGDVSGGSSGGTSTPSVLFRQRY